MAKNRKNQAAEIRFGPVLKVVLMCGLICGAAIGFVWQKSQIERLGRQYSLREARLKQLKADNKTLSDQIAYLNNPVMLDQRAKALGLGLAPAQPAQMVRLVDLPPAPAQDTPRQFAERPVAGGKP